MALPASFQQKPVHGKWVTLAGTPAVGQVVFKGGQVLRNEDENIIVLPGSFTAILSLAGEINVVLPSTNDTDYIPVGWAYEVTETFIGFTRSYILEVPYDFPGTIELADIGPTGTAADVVRFVQLGELDVKIAEYLEKHPGSGGGSGGSGLPTGSRMMHVGNGRPGTVIGSRPGDAYLDLDDPDYTIYTLV